jgi:PAS domain S-box-containing protein
MAEAGPDFVALRRLAELSGDGLVIVDAHHRCLYVNPSGCTLLGVTEAELRGRDFVQQFPAHERGALTTCLASPDGTQAYRWSSIARRSGDREHAFEYAALPCAVAGEPAVAVMLRDVTEHRELERRATALAAIGASMAYAGSLKATLEGLARKVVQAIGIQACLLWVFDEERKCPFVGGTYGLPAGYVAAVDALWRSGVTPPSARAFESRQIVVDRTYRQRLLDPAFAAQHEYIRAAPWDTLVYVPLIYREEAVGTLVCYYPAGADPGQAEISFLNAVAVQAAVVVENARLYERAQEAAVLEERQRLSRELHDSVSQALYSIALGAKTAHALLSPGSAVIEPLEFVLAQTERGLAEMRALIFELRPEALEQEGLAAALQRQINAVQARHQIVVMTTLCEEPDVPLAVKEAVYRIAQEALHNIVKHANARSAEVRLEYGAEQFTLDVSDDGAGFDPGEEFPGHLGLRTMRERAMRLGGTLDIESGPSAGTRVRVHIPTRPHG